MGWILQYEDYGISIMGCVLYDEGYGRNIIVQIYAGWVLWDDYYSMGIMGRVV